MVYTISRQSRDAERMRQMTETKRLYYEDVYKKEFTAKVLECREAKKGFHIILDESAFYPEGGGQPSDTGYLNDVKVKEVHEKEGELLHYTDQPMEVGTEVQGRIDWARRFDLMQQHSGEHMVSGLKFPVMENCLLHLERMFSNMDGKKWKNGSLNHMGKMQKSQKRRKVIFQI